MSAPEPSPSPTPEPSPEPTPEPSPTTNWMDQAGLSEDMKGHPTIQKFQDVASLAQSYLEAQKLIGADKIVKPGKDATPEQMAEFYNALGRPENVDGYGFAEWSPPDGLPWDADLATRLTA